MYSVLSVVGARPQFVKAAVVSRTLADIGIKETLVHTGQHYDEAMSGQLMRQLGLPAATQNLQVGSANHAKQTAKIMVGLDDFVDASSNRFDAMVIYGDTNSTIAAALVASKRAIPVAHVEAGLRSFNRKMPEELNRVVADHLSARLYCSSALSVENLKNEGISEGVLMVGDVMLDALRTFTPIAIADAKLDGLPVDPDQPFILTTIHRPSNTDEEAVFNQIIDAFGDLGTPCLWPAHPRTRAALSSRSLPSNVKIIEPVGYFEMLALLAKCKAVATDSGGLQKEAYWSQKKCVTLRAETEWVETLEGNWNTLIPPGSTGFPGELAGAMMASPSTPWRELYGDGEAGRRIAQDLSSI